MANTLIKTDFKNLYYYYNSKKLKIYVAVIYKDKKRYKKTLGFINITKAKKELNLYRLDVENQSTELTFSDVFKEYMSISILLQSKGELKAKQSYFDNHIKSLHNININHIKYSDVQKVINDIIDKGLALKTAKNVKATIQVVFNFAIKQNYTEHNPATIVIIPSFDNKQYLKISIIQAKKLVENIFLCKNIPVRDIMILGLHGRRLSECLNMQWFQINLDEKFYSLPHQKNKAKKNMQFSMTDTLYSMFKNRYKIALDSDTYSSDDYVFLNPNTLTKYTDISRTFKKVKIASDIEISDFRFHDFRHLLGTYSINELNIPIELVSHTLGHTNIATTEIYITKNKTSSKTVNDSYLKLLGL